MKVKRHSPEQIIRKLRTAEQLLNQGQAVADVCRALEIHKITPSMSAKGCCWDNAVAESFFSTLKHELDLDDNAKALNTPQQLRRQLAFWIDGYYNRERRHSTIGYVSPINYEQQFISAFTLTTVEP